MVVVNEHELLKVVQAGYRSAWRPFVVRGTAISQYLKLEAKRTADSSGRWQVSLTFYVVLMTVL